MLMSEQALWIRATAVLVLMYYVGLHVSQDDAKLESLGEPLSSQCRLHRISTLTATVQE
jgi:hypothetical protein